MASSGGFVLQIYVVSVDYQSKWISPKTKWICTMCAHWCLEDTNKPETFIQAKCKTCQFLLLHHFGTEKGKDRMSINKSCYFKPTEKLRYKYIWVSQKSEMEVGRVSSCPVLGGHKSDGSREVTAFKCLKFQTKLQTCKVVSQRNHASIPAGKRNSIQQEYFYARISKGRKMKSCEGCTKREILWKGTEKWRKRLWQAIAL